MDYIIVLINSGCYMIDCVKKIVFEKKYDKYMIGIAV